MLPSGLPAAFSAAPDSDAFVGERAIAPVDPQLVGGRVVGDVEIEPAVAVVVADRYAKPGAVGSGDARGLGDVGEPALPVVAVQPVGHRPVGARPAVVARAERVRTDLVVGHGKVEVIGDEEIEVAVPIVVEERGARAPERVAHARRGGDVGKRAVAVVAIERVGTERREKEVEVAVVVVIARRPHPFRMRATRSRRATVTSVNRSVRRPPAPTDEVVAEQAAGRRSRLQSRRSSPLSTRKTSRSPSPS